MKTLGFILVGGLAAAVLAGCGAGGGSTATTTGTPTTTGPKTLPGTNRPQVTIGDKNFTEQFVLGELYAEALTAQGYSVQVNRNIGPTEVTMQALLSGRLDMYPEYLGIWDSQIAGVKRSFRTLAGAYLAGRRWARERGLRLLTPSRFSDTMGIAVTSSYAAAHGLRTIADLRKVAPELTLGGPPQFQQEASGLPALEQAYGFAPAQYKTLAVGAQYQALQQPGLQAAVVNTTDGPLTGRAFRLLRDPARVFGWGQVVPVVPLKVLNAEGPAFAATIERVDGLLTLGAIRRMNAAVDVGGQDPVAVAKGFLEAHGLLTASA